MIRRQARLAHLAAALVAALAVAACGDTKQAAGGFHGFPPADVTLYTVEPKDIPVTFEYVGQAVGSKEVEVRARVGGILEKRLFKEGAPVKAGQTLFVLDQKPLEAQAASVEADLARAQAQLAQAQREAARLKPLAEKKAIGQKEYDDAVSTGELAAASVKAAEAKLRESRLSLGYARVVAPVSGMTSRAAKSEGSLVAAGTDLLTTISQVDPIWVQFNISENEKLKVERAVAEKKLDWPGNDTMSVAVKLGDGTLLKRKGSINFADTRINTATGTYETRAEFANRDNALKSGQFLRVILNGPKRIGALAVPQAAVLDGPQGKFVYVAGKDKDGKDVALPKPVTLGDWVTGEGNLWIVESGLAAGDKVIVDGIAKIFMPGAPIKIGGAPPVDGKAAAPNPEASKSEASKSEASKK
ncbi:MAG: efflux RND transporter periplasmic adaptor subunit [Betaproteobacteria bacterium]